MPESRLDSWKGIAAHLGRSVRTVQRWERQEGLPVHRLQHEKIGSVYAYPSELDAWWEARRVSLEAAGGDDGGPDEEAAEEPREPPRPLGLRAAALGLLVLVAAAYGGWRLAFRPPSPKGPARLAVLPFANLTGSADREYITDGLTEEMIAALGRVRDLGVIARTSVMRYKQTDKTVSQIARELRVDYVLEGSVREAGQRLRVTAQLIRTSDETHLWAENYDREVGDLLAVQGDVARRVAEETRLHLPPPDDEKTDPQAYLAYLRGRFEWNKRTKEGFEAGLVLFRQALDRDPRFARAWSGVADTYVLLSNYGHMDPRQAMPQALAAASRAVELDDSLAEGHASLGVIHHAYTWEFDRAEREFRRALALNPNYARAHLWYGIYLNNRKRFDEARAVYRQGLDADPLSEILRANLVLSEFYARPGEDSLTPFRERVLRRPEDPSAHEDLGRALGALGRHADAVGEFEKAAASAGDEPMVQAQLAYHLGRDGREKDAARILDGLVAAAKTRRVAPYYLALVETGLGRTDRALGYLEQVVTERHVGAISLNVDPEFDPLRPDPRFVGLLHRIGLQ